MGTAIMSFCAQFAWMMVLQFQMEQPILFFEAIWLLQLVIVVIALLWYGSWIYFGLQLGWEWVFQWSNFVLHFGFVVFTVVSEVTVYKGYLQ